MKKAESKKFKIRLSDLTVLLIVLATFSAVSVCVLFFVRVYSRSLFGNAQVNSEQTVFQTALSVDNYLTSVKKQLDNISILMEECDTPKEYAEKISVFANVQNDIYCVTVYDEQGNVLLCSQNSLNMKISPLKDLSFDKALFDNALSYGESEYVLSKPHVQTLFENSYPWVVTIACRKYSELFDKSVYIALDFKFSGISSYIDNVGLGRHGYCYVIDSFGNIVYHPQQQLLYSGLKSENIGEISAFDDGVYSGKNVIYSLKTISEGNWRVVGVNYTDELASERRKQIIIGLLVSFICCAIISLAVLVLFSKIVDRPVKTLSEAMKEFEKKADSEYNGAHERVSELQTLSDSFSHMSKKIKQLMEKVKNDETALRKTELKALQAQINPHFLYNTLDSIQWMCENGNNKDAVKMVGALARLFRISISRGREFISVKEEMQHAESYLIIQSFRYKNQFSYKFDVQPEIEEYLCNKITVQPLIENAIYHGIDRYVYEGEIKISAKEAPENPEDILITVSDNGVGMTQEQCERILRKEKSDSSGIGVKNVNDRLKIYFGEKYGLSIKSELDVGTVVTVRIPKIKKEPENEN